MIKSFYYFIKKSVIEFSWKNEKEWQITHCPNFSLVFNEKWNEIERTHNYYVENISTDAMAISKETSQFLYSFLYDKKKLKVLDFGSGFSSYLFRYMSIDVYSVDDNLIWLEKTKSFLNDKNINLEKLFYINDELWKSITYDFIFVDLNFIEERVKYIDLILNLTHEKSIIFFDDVHKIDYLNELGKKINKQRGYLLKKLTLDTYGRFGMIYYL